MIAIRGLAVVAIFGCVAIALAPTSGADPARKDALSFARQAERACLATNAQKLVLTLNLLELPLTLINMSTKLTSVPNDLHT